MFYLPEALRSGGIGGDLLVMVEVETSEPSAVVTEVARRWQVSPQQVFDWRCQAREALVAVTVPSVPTFVPIMPEAPAAMSEPSASSARSSSAHFVPIAQCADLDREARFNGEERLSPTAARMSALNASSSITSPSRMSIARMVLPLNPLLNKLAGSWRAAPLAKVSLT